jgi:hypothetical protein
MESIKQNVVQHNADDQKREVISFSPKMETDHSNSKSDWFLYHLFCSFSRRLLLCYPLINIVATQMVNQYWAQIRHHLAYLQL